MTANGPQVRHERHTVTDQVTADIARLRLLRLVNVYFVGQPGARDGAWVLVDAGLPGTAGRIAQAAAGRFGPDVRPAAIVLTHGHFDHVGALAELAARWDVPVYAHRLELPYLTGRSAYPPPDPAVGGGVMPRVMQFSPRDPIDLGRRVQALPPDGSLPGLPGWRAVYTPGHSPGHIALFREADRLLLAGDACVTVNQESLLAVLAQRQEIHRPPAYFTPDWAAAHRSVEALAALQPATVATGHGTPMRGPAMQQALQALARDFDRLAVPPRGRYLPQPALMDERGVVSVPPPVADPLPLVLAGIGLAAALVSLRRRNREVLSTEC